MCSVTKHKFCKQPSDGAIFIYSLLAHYWEKAILGSQGKQFY